MCRPRPATPKFPELTPQLGGILKAYYAELAAGTGRWSIKAASTPMPVGPADAAIWSTCAAAGDSSRSQSSCTTTAASCQCRQQTGLDWLLALGRVEPCSSRLPAHSALSSGLICAGSSRRGDEIYGAFSSNLSYKAQAMVICNSRIEVVLATRLAHRATRARPLRRTPSPSSRSAPLASCACSARTRRWMSSSKRAGP